MGPSAVRLAGLHTALARNAFTDVEDLGNIETITAESIQIGDPSAKYLEAIVAFCETLSDGVREILGRGRVPVVIGGDHSCAVGTISGFALHHREQGRPVGVIWIDAHADMNTPETSPSGNVHGMPLSALLGMGRPELVNLRGDGPKLEPDRVALIGIRDVDGQERELVARSGVHAYTMSDIDEQGMGNVMRDAIAKIGGDDAALHVSFDLDGMDPRHAPGVGTAVDGGITYREAHLAMEIVADTGQLGAVEMVEINPILDVANRTGRVAMELILSALGKRIIPRRRRVV